MIKRLSSHKTIITLILGIVTALLCPLPSLAEYESVWSWERTQDLRYKLEIHASESKYNLDVINMFADHLQVKSESSKEQGIMSEIRLWAGLFVFGKYSTAEVELESSDTAELEKTLLNFYDYNYGLGYRWESIGLLLGVGGRTYHTFLETDTSFYFHQALESQYHLLKLDYIFATGYFFDVQIYIENQEYIPIQIDDFKIQEGFVRTWGGRIIMGPGIWRYGVHFSQTHRSVKMIRDFFGLDNEMNNKEINNQFSVFTSIEL